MQNKTLKICINIPLNKNKTTSRSKKRKKFLMMYLIMMIQFDLIYPETHKTTKQK